MKRAPIGDRRRSFWLRVQPDENGCWIWTGGIRSNGYGTFAVRREDGRWSQTTAHRWAYRDQVGPVEAGHEVDHLCKVRDCVRIDHLESVTLAENRRRRDGRSQGREPDRSPRPLPELPELPAPPPRRDPTKVCLNGHLYAEVGWRTNGPRRTCKGCSTEREARRRKGGAHGTETHCPSGHEYSPENTYVRKRSGRECKTCVNARNRANYHRRAAAKRAAA